MKIVVTLLFCAMVSMSLIAQETQKEEEQVMEVILDEPVQEDVIDENKVYSVVEVMPEFPGGVPEMYKFINEKMKYPKACVEGTVYISVVVDKDGSLINPLVIRGVSPENDKEALRVISIMPKWKPGTQSGKVVKVKYVMPVKFKLDTK